MATKASATITLSFMVDIKAVYRYYKLQSSTASAPSVPTTNPPTGWDDTEPNYTSGSTNTLYTVELTVFTNDTFLYSAVSKSSSYEAAKEAYNKAQAAQNNVDEVSQDIQTIIAEQNTSIINDCESIILSALENYVTTGDYEEFQGTISAQLEVLADQITMNFVSTTETIEANDENTNARFNQISKYIHFDADGITIGAEENSIKLSMDNTGIIFEKDGEPFGWWDGDDFHTGNIVVEVNERAQFGNFAFVPRSDGSLSFLKVVDQ